MKTANDYAQQALRFAARALTWSEADELAHAWEDAYDEGQRYARRYNVNEENRRAFFVSAMHNAANAARGARRARKGGWWAESWRDFASQSAKRAAWCAGYAAGA